MAAILLLLLFQISFDSTITLTRYTYIGISNYRVTSPEERELINGKMLFNFILKHE